MRHEARIAIPVPTSNDLSYNQRSWGMYAAAVQDAGGVPVRVELGGMASELMRLARGCDGVLLPGSPADVDPKSYGQERMDRCAPADPLREAADRILLEEAFAGGKPVLGICYGAQSLNVWRGGTLLQDIPPVPVNHEAGPSIAVAHGASVSPGTLLGGLVDGQEGRFEGGEVHLAINSSHHQAIERVGSGLRLVALSTQDGVGEAVEGDGSTEQPEFLLGVQWHPERSTAISATSRAIFAGLVGAAVAWKGRALAVVGG